MDFIMKRMSQSGAQEILRSVIGCLHPKHGVKFCRAQLLIAAVAILIAQAEE